MSVYKYQAYTPARVRENDELEAINEQAALKILEQRGLTVYALKKVDTTDAKRTTKLTNISVLSVRKSATSQDVLFAFQELSTLLNAGLPLADALYEISIGHRGTAIGVALDGMYSGLRSGRSFANVLHSAQLNNPNYVVELIRAGEETGKLAQSLEACCEQMTADAEFRRETRNALIYPMVLIFSGILASLIVFVFVVPKFAAFLSHPKADIPMFSRWILKSGLWLVQNKFSASGSTLFVLIVAGLALREKSVRASLWNLAAQIPITGRWIEQIELGRWASMLSVLLENRVPLLDALRHSRNSLETEYRRSQADLVLKDVQGGQLLAKSLETHRFLDSIGLNLIRVGEQSGKLAETTKSLGAVHRNAAKQKMKQFLVLLEPITILMISVFLGGIMISVMMAITSLTNVI